jgi:hypothetical protein
MYIGYPISLETAFTMFGYNQSTEDAQPRYNRLTAHLKKHELDLYFYDKNVYILGMRVNDFSAANDIHYSVNDAIELMIEYKHKVSSSLKASGANVADFNIEVMEGEPQRIQTTPSYVPLPYVIT